jgi:hypothetical protein
MKIAVFTSNQPRHVSLLNRLAGQFDAVMAVVEVNTIFPGTTADFYNNSAVMQDYFTRVICAEQQVFGGPGFMHPGIGTMPVKMGDLNKIPLDSLSGLLDADVVVVFGSSYIKGELCDRLIAKKAVNIHMGLSPYYRGSGCNFWALYDGNPHMVGATMHMLSEGLDSGNIIGHALPAYGRETDGFMLGMRAVEAAHEYLVKLITENRLFDGNVALQNKTDEIRYSRYADFDDAVVAEYLSKRLQTAQQITDAIKKLRLVRNYIRPYFAELNK